MGESPAARDLRRLATRRRMLLYHAANAFHAAATDASLDAIAAWRRRDKQSARSVLGLRFEVDGFVNGMAPSTTRPGA